MIIEIASSSHTAVLKDPNIISQARNLAYFLMNRIHGQKVAKNLFMNMHRGREMLARLLQSRL